MRLLRSTTLICTVVVTTFGLFCALVTVARFPVLNHIPGYYLPRLIPHVYDTVLFGPFGYGCCAV